MKAHRKHSAWTTGCRKNKCIVTKGRAPRIFISNLHRLSRQNTETQNQTDVKSVCVVRPKMRREPYQIAAVEQAATISEIFVVTRGSDREESVR